MIEYPVLQTRIRLVVTNGAVRWWWSAEYRRRADRASTHVAAMAFDTPCAALRDLADWMESLR